MVLLVCTVALLQVKFIWMFKTVHPNKNVIILMQNNNLTFWRFFWALILGIVFCMGWVGDERITVSFAII